MWRADEVIKAVGGVPFRIERDTFSSISTDSRTVGAGDLFIPLSGANYDGHLFVGSAYETSLGGSICEKGREDIYKNTKGTVILVDNALDALLDLARWKRERMRGTCIAITGSNGKTTTKEILVNMMKRSFSVAYNEKNYNNLIGVSKSILAIEGEPDFFVFELGTNSKGEIKALTRTTMPDVSLITNINPSHLEGLFDLEGVLHEKLDLFYLTREGGKVFVNADDPYIMPAYHDPAREACVYGIEKETPFRLTVARDLGWDGSEIILSFPGENVRATTRLLGKHNLYNILAASAIAYSVGLGAKEIKETIETFSPFSMRFFVRQSPKGFVVVDDTYNANPASMEWAVRTLAGLPCRGKRVAILGDMRELGEKTPFYHRELGKFLKSASLSLIALVGEHVAETFKELGPDKALLFQDKTALIGYMREEINEGDIVLVKGSRAAKMEEIVEALI
jgi:UDP-N-acetylmuramoyl-tripeptide--D-alanyl-D-alanine ligase